MKVSVALLTFNHAPFIRQALDSALSQIADFPYEVVVADDQSSDGTTEIVEGVARMDSRVRVLRRSRRLGSPFNFVDLLANCEGEYVAVLEGDDYWSLETKLQEQSDLLDLRRDFSLVFHAVVVQLTATNTESRYEPPIRKPSYALDDILAQFIPHPNSIMFRSARPLSLPSWFYEMSEGGFPLIVLQGLTGAFGYIDQPMSVYRSHGRGAFSSMSPLEMRESRLRDYCILRRALPDRYAETIDGAIQRVRSQLALRQIYEGDLSGARSTAWQFLASSARGAVDLRTFGRMISTAISPKLYRRIRLAAWND